MTNKICFRKLSDDIVIVEIENSLAIASVSLFGGHVMAAKDPDQASVLGLEVG